MTSPRFAHDGSGQGACRCLPYLAQDSSGQVADCFRTGLGLVWYADVGQVLDFKNMQADAGQIPD